MLFWHSGRPLQQKENIVSTVLPQPPEKMTKYDRMDLAMQQEFEMTVDHALGVVPRERLYRAYEIARRTLNSRAAIPNVNWIERGPKNQGGRTRTFIFDPNDPTHSTVFAGSVAGGLWKASNIYQASPDWRVVDATLSNLAVVSMAYDPSNPQVMYFGTGEGYYNSDAVRGDGIWKSTDGGSTWSQLASTVTSNSATCAGPGNCDFDYVNKIVVTSAGTVLAACRSIYTNRGGIMRSTDGGNTWTRVLPSTGIFRAADIEVAENGDLYAALGIFNTDGLYKSTDDGATWTKITGGGFPSSGFERIEIACAPSDSNRVLVLLQDAVNNDCYGIYLSSDAGSTWSSLSVPTQGANDFTRGQAWYDLIAAFDPTDSSRIFIGGIDLWLSENSGSSWTEISHWYGGGYQEVHADQHAIYFLPGSADTVLFGNDGGIYLSSNASLSSPDIEDRSENYNVLQLYAAAMHPRSDTSVFLGGAQDNGSHRYLSEGINYTQEVTGGDGAFCHIDQSDSNYWYTAYVYNRFYRSTDGGLSFSSQINVGATGKFINPSDFDNDANILYSSYNSGFYLRWDDPHTGTSFSSVNAGFSSQVSAVTCDPNTANRVWFGTDDGSVYYVDNANGGSPTVNNVTTASLPAANLSCIEIDPTDANHILITYSNYGEVSVWESTNAGSSWTDVEGNLPDMPVRWALFNPNNTSQVLLATEAGVWSTDNLNGGSTVWAASNSGMGNVRTDMLQYRSSDNLVVAATHGRGLFSSDVFTTASADFGAAQTVGYIGNAIRFYDDSYKATSWLWNFGDGNTSTAQNPTHSYSTAGDYTVTLTINGGAATKTKSNYIRVLPNHYIPFALTDGGNFEVNPAYFGANSTSGVSFERGNSTVAGKNGTNSGSNAWVTGLTASSYENYNDAQLWTPNFNMSVAGIYTLSFYAKYSTEWYSSTEAYDGFRLEYSLDKGDNWYLIGDNTFYNFANTNSGGSTAFPYGEPYFAGSVSSFTNYSLDISSLAGNSNVAFRFVFRSDRSVTDAGVSIDDFTITGPSTNLLPVVLTAFRAVPIDDHARIEWEIEGLEDLDHFELERSVDGRHFELLHLQEASRGTGSSRYSWNDFDITPGTYYYRLKIVEISGFAFYSEIREATFAGTQETTLRVWPNPAAAQVHVSISGLAAPAYLNVFTSKGRLIGRYELPASEVGGALKLETGDWASGVYFLQAELPNGQSLSRKLIKY